MSRLAIKGHSTRGKEVIELLEMLGGKSKNNIKGYNDDLYYYIAKDGLIYGSGIKYEEFACNYTIFTLEEFLEIFPYKVGDKVRVWSQHDDEFFYGSYSYESKTIKSMQWNEIRGKVAYTIEGIDRVFYKEELIPYKEEVNMKYNKDDSTLKGELYDDNRITYLIPDGYEFQDEEGNVIKTGVIKLVKKQPQYPKTYAECCKVIDYALEGETIIGYKASLLRSLQKLLIFRDAYWKIAGKEIGLDKPWKPDWENCCATKYSISCVNNKIKLFKAHEYNYILVFPTAEMRDAFYENFKDLIHECKEVL